MNHRSAYLAIITKAKSESRKKGRGVYYENHHILPRSLFPRWIDKKSNQVLLTAREHYFCHQLLSKIYQNDKMFLALWMMANAGQNKRVIKGSKEYMKLREQYANLCSMKYTGSGNPMFGKRGKDHPSYGYKFGPEEVAARKKRLKGSGNPMFGKKVSDERRALCKDLLGYRILCETTNEVFTSEKEAAAKTGVCRTSIVRCLNGEISRGYTVNTKTGEKFFWKILERGKDDEYCHRSQEGNTSIDSGEI